jgi:hypothetical protein
MLEEHARGRAGSPGVEGHDGGPDEITAFPRHLIQVI